MQDDEQYDDDSDEQQNYTVRSCYKLQHATFTDEYISSHFISYVSLSTLIPRPPLSHELEVEKA